MAKKLLITAGLAFILLVVIFIYAVYISFKTIKPTTEAINNDLEKQFSKIIYFPKGIPRPSYDFNETRYLWEMETPSGEVTSIKVKYNPEFLKDEKRIQLSLEMPENGDPSLFNKVMPAVVADKQSLDSALDPKKANLGPNKNAGYENINLTTKPETNQTIQIVWNFKKEDLSEELKSKYQKLSSYPKPILKFLYGLPHFAMSLAGA